MISEETVLVIAAHPDDEVLGCGGTLARHVEQGCEVHVLFVAEGGAASRVERENKNILGAEVASIREVAEKAAKYLGFRKPRFLGLPDNRLDLLARIDVIQPIEEAISEIRPVIVYTHHGGDLNIDHRRVHEAVVTACRPIPGSLVDKIYGFEVLSSTEWSSADLGNSFVPVRSVDISDFLDRKIRALEFYQSEMRPFPHARSVEAVRALAQVRGAQVGLRAAEAFTVIKERVR